ncbi:MAG TPA: prolyl oligopeptidase family serine peptidase, partial [Caulifigura sp.]|nr:prolyl oligopeptidase family serine peptidase [Caulifigura sp.]
MLPSRLLTVLTRVLLPVLVLIVVPTAGLLAQQPPYDLFPPADPPYYRVRYEGSATAGELIFPVNYTLWVPPTKGPLRGVIVHQHGCGEGSCKSGLTGAFDLHWQALAKKHVCALLSPSYEQPEKADCQMWCDPRNGSDAAFQKCLVDLGATSGHPELSTVPWALWGHSGGGHWAGGMTLLHPERVAAAWLRSGVPLLKSDPNRPAIKSHSLPAAALAVPIMCNLGTKEGVTVKDGRFAGVWPANEAFIGELRSRGGLICAAIDPLTAHECGNQRYFAIPWLDACLSARLPETAGDPLKPMPTSDVWLATIGTADAVAASMFTGDALKAGWLPNESLARAWRQYVTDTALADTTPPPAPRSLRIRANELTWEADADLESGLAGFIIERDGTPLASLPEQPKNPFGRPVFQGLQYSDTPQQPLVPLSFTDKAPQSGKNHSYRVIALNTAGLKSAPSDAATETPDKLSRWEGFERRDFVVNERKALLIVPPVPAAGKPWIWRTEFFGHQPQADLALLGRGFHVAYIDVQNMYGAPIALDHMDRFYEHLTSARGLNPKPVLEGFSRGGLFSLNWAARHPERVACIYNDAPVCDFKSWPGGKGQGKGSASDWKRCLEAYGLTEQQALEYHLNPVDNLEPLAKQKIPLLHVCGDADDVVPIQENTRLMEQRYRALGG